MICQGDILRHKKHKEYIIIKNIKDNVQASSDILVQEIELNYYTGGVWKEIDKPKLVMCGAINANYFMVTKSKNKPPKRKCACDDFIRLS